MSPCKSVTPTECPSEQGHCDLGERCVIGTKSLSLTALWRTHPGDVHPLWTITSGEQPQKVAAEWPSWEPSSSGCSGSQSGHPRPFKGPCAHPACRLPPASLRVLWPALTTLTSAFRQLWRSACHRTDQGAPAESARRPSLNEWKGQTSVRLLHPALRKRWRSPLRNALHSLPFRVGTGLSCPSPCPSGSFGSGTSASPGQENTAPTSTRCHSGGLAVAPHPNTTTSRQNGPLSTDHRGGGEAFWSLPGPLQREA